MLNLQAASRSMAFDTAFDALPERLQSKLRDFGLARCTTWAYLQSFEVALERFDDYEELRETAAVELLGEIGFADEAALLMPGILNLYDTAKKEANGIAARQGSLTDLQVSEDLISQSHKREAADEKTALTRAALLSLAHLPQEWRGKRYRRTAGLLTENAREEGERLERLQKGKEVAGLLAEARLPFALSLGPGALEGDTPLKCCRGLRAKTLAQRVACWRPFRRWLLANDHGPFPACAEQVLDFLGERAKEGAARTSQASLLASLRFLEEAGEVPLGDRLSQSPAVLNAVKEHGTAAAAGKKDANKQAPPLTLALLAACEDVVCAPGVPLYHRGYAWFKLSGIWRLARPRVYWRL